MKKAVELKKFKYRMTKHMTNEESFVDEKLNSLNIEYKKQMILGFYIIDFVLPLKMTCIEVDGLYHNNQKLKDAGRESFKLNEYQYRFVKEGHRIDYYPTSGKYHDISLNKRGMIPAFKLITLFKE